MRMLSIVSLKVPKCEIFDLFDFNDFYAMKCLQIGDLGAETWARYV